MDPTTQSKLMALNRDLRNISQQIDQLMSTGETPNSSNIESISGENSESVTSLPVKELVSRDILEVVYNHLSPEQRAIASRACKEWREILISNGDRWGSPLQPITVKRLQTLPQAVKVVEFFKTLPRCQLRLFVHNPGFQDNISVVRFLSYQLLDRTRIREIIATQAPSQANHLIQSLTGNLQIICESLNALNPPLSADQVRREFILPKRSDNAGWMSTLSTLEISTASPWGVYNALFQRRTSVFSFRIKNVSLFVAGQPDIPILLQKIELSRLHDLWLPMDFPGAANIFANFSAPLLSIIRGGATSILNLGSLLHPVQRLSVVLDLSGKEQEGEVLKLLAILTLASSLQSLNLMATFDPSKPVKQFLNLDRLLNLLQVKIDTDGWALCWCPNLQALSASPFFQLNSDLVRQVGSLKDERGIKFEVSGFTLSED